MVGGGKGVRRVGQGEEIQVDICVDAGQLDPVWRNCLGGRGDWPRKK